MSNDNQDIVKCWTDGSSNWKTKRGGIGIYLKYKEYEVKHSFGCYHNTTNNQMELWAVIRALQLLKPAHQAKVVIYSDSQYVVKSIKEKWVWQWDLTARINGFLWKLFIKEYEKFQSGKINFEWVKGHENLIEDELYEGNQIADMLAKEGYHNKTILFL